MKQIVLLLFLFGLAYGQEPDISVPPPGVAPNQSGSLPIQRVGPDDLLSLSVADSPELTRNFRVTNSGVLVLPLLKERIQASGKLPGEIEEEISTALVKEQLFVQPVVSVSVAEYRSLPVSVMGAVRHPTTFQATGDVSLLDALTRADGLSQDAGSEILITRLRASGNEDHTFTQRISVKRLIDAADPTLNIRLHGGEEVRVPPAGRVYVIGNVKKTGVFPIEDDNDTTVLKVIAQSEGLLPYTNKDAFIYRREAGKDNRNEIPVQLTRIMEHKSPDIQLQANDILYIPDSKGKKLSAQTIQTLTGFGVSAGTGLLIWR
ncbi:MAG TPA: polysaccharide biosynthesis/export family protein [Bryobacteraceae bacterium]|nr:polysaccharide biosynthesis/export family protein [Bryobacteraceae bacterium]